MTMQIENDYIDRIHEKTNLGKGDIKQVLETLAEIKAEKKKAKKKAKNPRPNRPLSMHHIKKLLEHTYDVRENVLIYGLLDTGMRIGDFTRIKWEDLDGKYLHYVSQKTNIDVYIPLNQKTLEILDRWKKHNKDERIMPLTPDRCRQILRAVRDRAGIKRKVSPHDFIDTAITNLLANKVPTKAVADLTGKKPETIDKYYAKFTQEQLTKWKEDYSLL